MLCESGRDFNRKDYAHYKPYQPPERDYDWHDYCKLSPDGMSVVSCHMCDIRETGCMSPTTPRYYCKRNKRSIQMDLGDYL